MKQYLIELRKEYFEERVFVDERKDIEDYIEVKKYEPEGA